jgi:hypothetical protein
MERQNHKKETNALLSQIKELQSVRVGVPCMHLALQYYQVVLFVAYHRTIEMKFVSVPNTLEINFRALLIKNNLRACNLHVLP